MGMLQLQLQLQSRLQLRWWPRTCSWLVQWPCYTWLWLPLLLCSHFLFVPCFPCCCRYYDLQPRFLGAVLNSLNAALDVADQGVYSKYSGKTDPAPDWCCSIFSDANADAPTAVGSLDTSQVVTERGAGRKKVPKARKQKAPKPKKKNCASGASKAHADADGGLRNQASHCQGHSPVPKAYAQQVAGRWAQPQRSI